MRNKYRLSVSLVKSRQGCGVVLVVSSEDIGLQPPPQRRVAIRSFVKTSFVDSQEVKLRL